jgi:hypothetical protein
VAPCERGFSPPTPVEDALADFEVNDVEGGYTLAWFSRNTGHHGERKQAAQEYFSELFDPDLAVERAKTMEDLRKARRIAYAFRFICPSYYIPGEQDWGAF